MMNLFKITIFLVLIVGCKPNQVIEPKKERVIKENINTYSILLHNVTGGKKEAQRLIIKDNESFLNLINDMSFEEESQSKVLDVDFNKFDVVCAFVGEKTTGGYDIILNKVEFLNQIVELDLEITEPKEGELTASVITSPYIFIQIPKNRTVIFK